VGLPFLRSSRRRFGAAAILTNRIRRSGSRLHERAKQQCVAEYERKQCKDKHACPDLIVIMEELPSGIFGHVHIPTLIAGRERLSSLLIEIMTTSETGHYPSWVGAGDCDGRPMLHLRRRAERCGHQRASGVNNPTNRSQRPGHF
jgi:hypothetical protein